MENFFPHNVGMCECGHAFLSPVRQLLPVYGHWGLHYEIWWFLYPLIYPSTTQFCINAKHIYKLIVVIYKLYSFRFGDIFSVFVISETYLFCHPFVI